MSQERLEKMSRLTKAALEHGIPETAPYQYSPDAVDFGSGLITLGDIKFAVQTIGELAAALRLALTTLNAALESDFPLNLTRHAAMFKGRAALSKVEVNPYA